MRRRNRSIPLIVVAALVLTGIAYAATMPREEPRLHLLYLDSAGFRLEPLHLQNGESRSFVIDRDSELIDVIYSVGTGTSGNVIQRSTNSYTVTVRREDDAYQLVSSAGGGRPRTLPPLSIADLQTYRVRLDITAADGRQKAFVIEAGRHVDSDVPGPVMDMFQGLVPLSAGDLSIMTRTEKIVPEATRPRADGEVEIVYDRGLLFAPASIGSGSSLEFIVDFASGTTVLAKSALPDGVAIGALEGVEYSDKGARKIESTMKGAGGDVSGFLGTATLPELTLGTLVFRDVEVSVLSSMPEFGGHAPDGILGMNLLSRAKVACLTYPTPGATGHLRLADRSHLTGPDVISFPFTRVGNHLFVSGAIDDAPVTFVFDTGARRTHLHPEVAKSAGIALRPDDEPNGTRGLDGKELDTRLADADELRLGEVTFARVRFVVADLPVFRTIGLGSKAGLLGNTFLEGFAEVEVDFGQEIIRLVPGEESTPPPR